MLDKLNIVKQRFDEVSDLIIQPDIIADQKRYVKLNKEYKDLKLLVDKREQYIAFTNNPNALPDADQVVKGLGMEYMHVPVDFSNPLPDDFYAFADSMQRNTDKKTLLHCQVNARATAFSFLYRVIHEGADMAEAKADMNTVWQPNEVWRDFIFEVLAQNDLDPQCEDCDWTLPPPRQ